MDVVYIYKNNTKSKELLYSLRSVDKHLKGVGNVFVVGGHPSWLSDKVIKIHAQDVFQHKQMNAIHKIFTACRHKDISEDFLLMNDDFYFLEDTHVDDIPNYTYGDLSDLFISQKKGAYKHSLEHAKRFLGFNNPKNFEVHYPMVINKESFRQVMNTVPWKNKSYVYRSLYGNELGLEYKVLVEDFKAFSNEDFKRLKDGCFLSSSDALFLDKGFVTWLGEKFSDKSRFEV